MYEEELDLTTILCEDLRKISFFGRSQKRFGFGNKKKLSILKSLLIGSRFYHMINKEIFKKAIFKNKFKYWLLF